MNTQEIVLSMMIDSRNLYQKIIEAGINQNMFVGMNKNLFNAICKYRTEHDVNTIVVSNLELENIRAKVHLSKVLDHFEADPIAYKEYIKALKHEYLNREWEKFKKIDDVNITKISKIIERLNNLRSFTDYNDYSLSSTIHKSINEIEKRNSKSYKNEYKLNLPDYDILGHFERKSLVVIGGESGHGKSSLIINMIYRWLLKGLSVIYFSYEMSDVVIASRLIVLHKGIQWEKVFALKDKKLNDDEFKQVMDGFGWLEKQSIVIINKMQTIEMMENIIRNYKPDIFILDTINTMIKEQQRVDIALGEIARRMKRIAVDYNSLALVVAQLKDLNDRPTDKNMVKESRQIRDEADYMDFIYREEEKNIVECPGFMRGVLELYRVKGRLTGVGYCYLGFDKNTMRVYPLPKEKYKEIDNYKYELRKKGVRR